MNFALYRPENDSFTFSSTYDPTGVLEPLVTVNHFYPADSLMLTKAFREKTTLIQDLTKEAPPQYQIRKAHAEKGLKLIINVPLMVGQECMGTFNIGTFDVNVISKDEIELLETLSSHLAIAINNAKMYEELQNESRQRKYAQEEVKLSLNKLRKTLDGTIQVLASTVEARDPYTAGHQRRVADLARAIATEMNLSQEQIDGIRMAGVIHDIGKLTVPIEILSKPGKLSEIEFNLIKTHPQVGYDIVKDIEFPERVIKMVLHHHERMDGSGYPQGLAGEDIIIEARVLAVADVLEAMASHRPYRPALGVDKALEEITRNSGTHYDPLVVEACLSCITRKGYMLTPAPDKVKPILRAQA
jgi:putative nucleotidyltransferase with HDIG domain